MMNVNDIYEWLLSVDPTVDNAQIRAVWSNMASYCYFINAIDFDAMYRDKLKRVLEKSQNFGIQIPDKNHADVLALAESVKNKHIEQLT